jgi:hypothetical protein
MMLTLPLWAVYTALGVEALGLLAALFLFLSLKRQPARDAPEPNEEIARIREHLEHRIDSLEARLRAAEDRSTALVPPPPLRSGFNLNKRTQVLRLSRQGEKPSSIAAALQLPRAEVELLLRVEELAAANG